jgi:TRAP-type C4-dicarboxylate transport system substrate-binding protein
MTLLLPQYEFMGTGKPPRNLEDWKGMRVRALGGLGDAMKMLGAVPTSVSAPEVYTALERGTFQAASFPFTYSFTAYKLHEVSKWYTLGMQLGVVHNSVVLSQTAWKALPDEYKKILEDAKPEAYRLQREAYAEADKKSFPLFDKRKLEAIKVTPEMREKLITTAAKPVWDHWVADTEKKSLPGKEALELVLSLAKKHATN